MTHINKRWSHLTLCCFAALAIPFSALAQTSGMTSESTEEATVEKPAPVAGQQADAYYSKDEMEKSREELKKMLGNRKTGSILFNQFEAQSVNGSEDLYWNGQAWYGGDINKIWFKSEGLVSLNSGKADDAELQALWSRAISPYFNLQTGIRHDFKPKGLDHAVFGVQGLAPYWFEVDVSGYLSTKGDVTARAEIEYDYRLTQRLILQPRIEANFSAQDIAERDLGSGLTDVNAGLRMRYEIKRQFAPYLGVELQGKFGGTRDIAKLAGNSGDQTVFLVGIRSWY